MKKLFSARYSAGAVNTATLFLRLTFGILIAHHGWGKLENFDATAAQMTGFFGMSGKVATSLLIFAEFFCGILVVIGLATRFACIPLIIAMAVAVVKVHNMQIMADAKGPNGEPAFLYLMAFVSLLIIGPGKVSVD